MGERSGYTKGEDKRIQDIKMGRHDQAKGAERNMGANQTAKPKKDVEEIQEQRGGAGLRLLQNPLFQKPY